VWRKFYRGFLGLDRYKNNVPPSSGDDRPLRPSEDDENPKNSLRNTPRSLDNFQVFTDPLEMHRFFEQQMEDMFRNFATLSSPDFGSALENEAAGQGYNGHLNREEMNSDRELMLKHDDTSHERKEDSDFDSFDLTADDIEKFIKTPEGTSDKNVYLKRGADTPSGAFRGFSSQNGGSFVWPGTADPGSESTMQSFSFSRSMRTIQRSDGSIETEERIRNPDGSETVTVRRRTENGETIESNHDPRRIGPVPSPSFGTTLFPENKNDPLTWDSWSMLSPPVADKEFTSIFSKFFGN